VEDFAAFNVDVTTEDPGADGLRKASDQDGSFGIRVCIGGFSLDWCEAQRCRMLQWRSAIFTCCST
jgi:hypothetical protein